MSFYNHKRTERSFARFYRFLFGLAAEVPTKSGQIQIGGEERKTKMKKALARAAVMLLCLGGIAQANITIDTVAVGNAGNAADTTGYGSVAYNYNIGKYEVTAGQYTDFLNNKARTDSYGLYNTSMDTATAGCKILRSGSDGNYTYSVAADWANRPVNFVSYWDACRFANWLNNGQATGDTETGAYTLNGYNGTDGRTVQRNAESTWFLTSEDEWYKAAYYKGGGTNAGYWDYPTQSDSEPSNDLTDPDGGNNANFAQSGYTIGSPYYRTNVGEFENSKSAYGMFDMGGNVIEWNETLDVSTPPRRGYRGGGFSNLSGALSASSRFFSTPTSETTNIGFRVAADIPEPTVTAITPNSGVNTGIVSITDLAGTGFQAGATVKLTKASKNDIVATSVNVVTTTEITCSLDLASQALGLWNVVVTNPDTQSGMLENGFTITDGVAPVINSVVVSPTMAAVGDTVYVVVDVTDDVGVAGVRANEVGLDHQGDNIWTGAIPVDSTLGEHPVIVVARDAADNTATDSSRSYKTVRVVGINNRDLAKHVASDMAGNFLFVAWGSVKLIDPDTFELDDGSATPVRVAATSHGLKDGDYALARGIWSATEHVLNSCKEHVMKIN